MHKERIKRVSTIVKRLIGSVNSEQQAAIEAWSLKLTDTQTIWYANRLQRSQYFFDALAQRNSPVFTTVLQQLMLQPESLYSVTYQQSYNEKISHGTELFMQLQHALSDKQKRRLNDSIDDYIQDFTELSTKSSI